MLWIDWILGRAITLFKMKLKGVVLVPLSKLYTLLRLNVSWFCRFFLNTYCMMFFVQAAGDDTREDACPCSGCGLAVERRSCAVDDAQLFCRECTKVLRSFFMFVSSYNLGYHSSLLIDSKLILNYRFQRRSVAYARRFCIVRMEEIG